MIHLSECCIELATDKKYSGKVEISDSDIRLEVFAYDQHCWLNPPSSIHLHTENNKKVSLYDGLPVRVGGSNSSHFSYTSKTEMIFGTAIVGRTAWLPESKVKRVTFLVSGIERFFHNRLAGGKENSSWFYNSWRKEIFHQRVGGELFGMCCAADIKGRGIRRQHLETEFYIEFATPVSVETYLSSVTSFVGFLSFCCLKPLRPNSIKISEFTWEEREELLHKDSYVELEHEIFHRWTDDKETSNLDYSIHWPFISADNTRTLRHFLKCLDRWMSADRYWKKAQLMYLEILRQSQMHSADRLKAAYNCLAEIPTAKPVIPRSKDQINEIIAAATDAAQRLQLDPEKRNRIRNALNFLSQEPHKERLKRIEAKISKALGRDILPQDFVNHLQSALKIRDKSSHGYIDFEERGEFLKLVLATSALEATCLLLLLCELPQRPHKQEAAKVLGPIHLYLSTASFSSR